MILTEGIGGILGPRYIRFIFEIPRGPYAKRRVLWARPNPSFQTQGAPDNRRMAVASDHADTSTASATKQTNHGEDLTSETLDGLTCDEPGADSDDELTLDELDGRVKDEPMTAAEPTPTIESEALDGLNPFSDSDEGPTSSWMGGDFSTSGMAKSEPAKSELFEEPRVMYAPTPTLVDHVKGDLEEEEEEESDGSGVDVIADLRESRPARETVDQTSSITPCVRQNAPHSGASGVAHRIAQSKVICRRQGEAEQFARAGAAERFSIRYEHTILHGVARIA